MPFHPRKGSRPHSSGRNNLDYPAMQKPHRQFYHNPFQPISQSRLPELPGVL